MRPIPTVVLGFALATSPLAGQQSATVSGRVVERGGRTGIVGVTVELSGSAAVLTGPDGTFLLRLVVAGPHTLSTTALGYAGTSIDLIVSGDTTLVLELALAPIRLDSLVVQARDVTVKGDVKDRASNIGLVHVDVYAAREVVDLTDGTGRFKIKDVPANVPVSIRVEEFGYLPMTAMIAPENDTTLHFALVPDPIVAKMIDRQIVRIAERAGESRYEFVPPIDRETLMRSRSQSVREIIRRTYRRRVGCITIDERRYSGAIMAHMLDTMLPDEIEHIDALWSPNRTSLILRIYTRDFVRRMIANADILVPLEAVMTGAEDGICR